MVGEEDDDFPRRDISGMIKLRRMRRMSVSQASDTSNGSLGDALAAARSPRRGGSGGGGGAGSSGDGTDIGGEESELRHMLRSVPSFAFFVFCCSFLFLSLCAFRVFTR